MSLIINGLSDKELTCEEYYVAYFDALGTKASLKKDEKSTFSKLWLVSNFIKTHRSKDVIIRSFSDNFLFAVKINGDNPTESLNSLFNVAAGFAVECLSVYELLVRGAIVKGLLHIDSEIVLGESLIRAYELESKVAIYPRIVIDKDILENIDSESLPTRRFDKPFFKDSDSSICVNPLFFFNEKIREALKNRVASNIINSAVLAHDNHNESSFLKVEWIKNYVNEFYFQNHGYKLITFNKKAFNK